MKKLKLFLSVFMLAAIVTGAAFCAEVEEQQEAQTQETQLTDTETDATTEFQQMDTDTEDTDTDTDTDTETEFQPTSSSDGGGRNMPKLSDQIDRYKGEDGAKNFALDAAAGASALSLTQGAKNLAEGLTERSANADAAAAMSSYYSSFRCGYDGGSQIMRGESGVMPGLTAKFLTAKNEYDRLAGVTVGSVTADDTVRYSSEAYGTTNFQSEWAMGAEERQEARADAVNAQIATGAGLAAAGVAGLIGTNIARVNENKKQACEKASGTKWTDEKECECTDTTKKWDGKECVDTEVREEPPVAPQSPVAPEPGPSAEQLDPVTGDNTSAIQRLCEKLDENHFQNEILLVSADDGQARQRVTEYIQSQSENQTENGDDILELFVNAYPDRFYTEDPVNNTLTVSFGSSCSKTFKFSTPEAAPSPVSAQAENEEALKKLCDFLKSGSYNFMGSELLLDNENNQYAAMKQISDYLVDSVDEIGVTQDKLMARLSLEDPDEGVEFVDNSVIIDFLECKHEFKFRKPATPKQTKPVTIDSLPSLCRAMGYSGTTAYSRDITTNDGTYRAWTQCINDNGTETVSCAAAKRKLTQHAESGFYYYMTGDNDCYVRENLNNKVTVAAPAAPAAPAADAGECGPIGTVEDCPLPEGKGKRTCIVADDPVPLKNRGVWGECKPVERYSGQANAVCTAGMVRDCKLDNGVAGTQACMYTGEWGECKPLSSKAICERSIKGKEGILKCVRDDKLDGEVWNALCKNTGKEPVRGACPMTAGSASCENSIKGRESILKCVFDDKLDLWNALCKNTGRPPVRGECPERPEIGSKEYCEQERLALRTAADREARECKNVLGALWVIVCKNTGQPPVNGKCEVASAAAAPAAARSVTARQAPAPAAPSRGARYGGNMVPSWVK
ncbi:MAG: hypothetical protein LBR41_03480 [Rickettsiales bacterium]|jgi:septal ring-binding cell division protein DamX|nr:hypothetical protein [Rickettsiales bacterium]